MSVKGKLEIITPAECADYLKCHITTIYRLIRLQQLPYFKIGNVYRFSRRELDAWMKAGEVNSSLPESRPRKLSA